MSSTTNLAITALIVAACGTDGSRAPTYSELYTKYFAVGTRGHCANDDCHGGANYNIWLCGPDKDTCYTGMVTAASLVNPGNPSKSRLADPASSPLSWINPSGAMPFDAPGPFPEGRDAILAWIADGARND